MANELPLITMNADELSSINNPNPSPLKRKRSAGRRKIPIERIQNKDALQVCCMLNILQLGFLRILLNMFDLIADMFLQTADGTILQGP